MTTPAEAMAMNADTRVKMAIYAHFAETGRAPTPGDAAARAGADAASVLDSYRRLREQRVLVLEADGATIRMAPPFSGVPTQHTVEAGGIRYTANCAWDSFGIPAALHREAVVHSRCEQSGEPFQLTIGRDGPESSTWLFHVAVPARGWWDDIVYT
ncbi:MAG TPA: organomercurial lyase [Candidatus Eisenbacteria bacterium]|nr:organomercurial lyase [Candidatus Eisenbacteria bacterium]